MRRLAWLAVLAMASPLAAAGVPGQPPPESKNYVGFGFVSCGPPGSSADGGIGGACFDTGPFARSVRIAVSDMAFPRTAAAYAFYGFVTPRTPLVTFCDATTAPIPRFFEPSLRLLVEVLDPAQAALACGPGAAGLAGNITAGFVWR